MAPAISVLLSAVFLLGQVAALAATNQVTQKSTRYLFVIDISSAMRATDPANRQALFDLVYTGIDGQMRAGDSFGIWLFNEELYAGMFPMQIWEPDRNLELGSMAAKFLRGQTYKHKCRPEAAMAKIVPLAKSIRDLNILFLTSGTGEVQGTPLDARINATLQKRREEQRKAEKPFILTMVVRKGQLVGANVSLPGEHIPLPPPQEVVSAPVTAPTNSMTVRAATVVTSTVPFILRGQPKKQEGLASAQADTPGELSPIAVTSVDPHGTSLVPASVNPPEPRLKHTNNSSFPPGTTVPIVLAQDSRPLRQTPEGQSAGEPRPARSPMPTYQGEPRTEASEKLTSEPVKAARDPVLSDFDTQVLAAQLPDENPSSRWRRATPPLKVAARERSTTSSTDPSSETTVPVSNGYTLLPLSGWGVRIFGLLGAGLLGALVTLSIRRGRSIQHTSLISRSMEQ